MSTYIQVNWKAWINTYHLHWVNLDNCNVHVVTHEKWLLLQTLCVLCPHYSLKGWRKRGRRGNDSPPSVSSSASHGESAWRAKLRMPVKCTGPRRASTLEEVKHGWCPEDEDPLSGYMAEEHNRGTMRWQRRLCFLFLSVSADEHLSSVVPRTFKRLPVTFDLTQRKLLIRSL